MSKPNTVNEIVLPCYNLKLDIADHILSAIDAACINKYNIALLHACIAVDATAKRLFPKEKVRNRFVGCLRQYYWLIEPMLGGGIDLEGTKFSNINLKSTKAPDISEIIYEIFRCNLAHGEKIPMEFNLIVASAEEKSKIFMGNGVLHLPSSMLWALLSVSVFSRVNSNENRTSDYFLSLNGESFQISEWWGREDDFRSIADRNNKIRVRLDKLERLKDKGLRA